MTGKYKVAKLNKVKLVELSSDIGIYSWPELSRKIGCSESCIPYAWRNSDGCVSIETALRLSQLFGKKISAFAEIIEKTAGPRKTKSVGADFAKKAKELAEKPADKSPKPQEEKEPSGNESPGLQRQLILRELKMQAENVQRLTDLEGDIRTDLVYMRDVLDYCHEELKKQTELMERLVQAWER